jgi:hypothetical protein
MLANIWVVPRAPRVRLRQAAFVAATLAYLSAYAAAILAGLTLIAQTQEAALWETTCSGLLFAVALTLWLCDVQRSRSRPVATVTTLSGARR